MDLGIVGIDAGPYWNFWTFSGTDDYNTDSGLEPLEIRQAPLTVQADNQTRGYGLNNPAFTAHYVGFVNGETPGSLGGALTFSTPANTASHVGSYPITPVAALPTNTPSPTSTVS